MTPLHRDRLRELTPPECLLHLRRQQYRVGRVAVGGQQPVILPVNYVLNGSAVVIRTASPTILAAAGDDQWLAFEIDRVDGDPEAGEQLWSVLVRGPSSVVTGDAEATYLRLSHLEPVAGGLRPAFVRIAIEELTGRAIG